MAYNHLFLKELEGIPDTLLQGTDGKAHTVNYVLNTDTMMLEIETQNSPTPSGGSASAANQLIEIDKLTSIDDQLVFQSTAAKQDDQIALATLTNTKFDTLLAKDFATSALQSTGNTYLLSIDGKTPALVAGRVPVDGSGVTQPISAVALPLPSGASQEHTAANSPSSVRLTDGSAFYKATTPSDTQPVSLLSIPLPSGAATEAKQDVVNASAASIDNKIVLYRYVAPTTLTNGQSIAINTIGMSSMRAKISGSWAGAPIFQGSFDGITYTPLGAYWADGSQNPSISPNIDNTGSYLVDVSSLASVNVFANGLTGSITVEMYTSPLQLGFVYSNDGSLFTETILRDANTGTELTGTNIGAKWGLDVNIIGSDSAVPISAVSLPLPSLASTSTLQTAGNASVASIDTKTPTVGQKAMAASSPVVIASDQSAVPVSFTQPALVASSAIIGKVGIDQTTPGTTNAVSLSHVGSTAVATGNGVVGAGVQRVAIASDNTAFPVNATLSAETTKVIGTVNIAAAQTIAATQSGTWTVQPGNTANTTPWLAKINDGTTSANVIAATNALKSDTSSIAGTATVTAAAGVQKVGITGATAVTMDSADGAAAPANGISTTGLYSTTIPALTTGNAGQLRIDSTGALYTNIEGRKATYSCASIDQTIITSASAPSFSLTGSATKTVRILKIGFSATASTGGLSTVILRRFSALSGGTSAAVANINKHDTNNGNATAAPLAWSGAAGTATTSGVIRTLRFELPTPAVTVQPVQYEWDFSGRPGQSLILRGTGEFIGLCFNGIGTTPIAEIYIEWTEE